MKKAMVGIVGIICLLMISGMNAQEVNIAAEVSQDDLRLTVYTNNMAIVQDTRTVTLTAGLNQIDFAGIPAQIDSTSVTLNVGHLLQQNIIPPDPDTSFTHLFQENIGHPVSFLMESGATIEGILTSVNGAELLIRLEDGRTSGIYTGDVDNYVFSIYPEDRQEEYTLRLLVDVPSSGNQQLTLTYITNGISWQSVDYNLSMVDDQTNLSAWVTLQNATNTTFETAQVVLAAGDFNRVDFVARDAGFTPATPTAMMTPTPNVYQQPTAVVFPVPMPITLEAAETQWVEFLPSGETQARNIYVYDSSPRVYNSTSFITEATYGVTSFVGVSNYLEFESGVAMPGGQMRIYETRPDGNQVLIGDTPINYIEAEQAVYIFLNESALLTGERSQQDFQVLSNDAVQETIRILLTNNTDEAVQIDVPERMTRSSSWEILAASMPFEYSDGFGVEFAVDVPPMSSVEVSYTVMYTRPQ